MANYLELYRISSWNSGLAINSLNVFYRGSKTKSYNSLDPIFSSYHFHLIRPEYDGLQRFRTQDNVQKFLRHKFVEEAQKKGEEEIQIIVIQVATVVCQQ